MSLSIYREAILAGIESTYDTDPTLTAGANGVLVEEPAWNLEGLRMIERNPIKASHAREQKIFGGTLRKVSFKCEVKGSGTAGTAPEIGPLLRACGMSETIVASTSVTYSHVSTGFESLTLYYYMDGLQYIITGARGNVELTFEVGNRIMASFEFVGHSVAPTDVALVAPTYDTTTPEALIGAPFAVNSYAAKINSITVNLNNQIAMPADITAADGYHEIQITGRAPSGSFDPEHTLVATQDWEGDLRAGTLRALTTGAIGATAGNIVTMNLDNIGYMDIGQGERESLRTNDIPFECYENAGEDEVELVFT